MSNNKYKILVIEDEKNIQNFVGTALEANQYQVIPADTCQMGKMLFSSHNPDLVILDLGLPDEDGVNFIRFARESSRVPIIVLSARNSEVDKVEALDAGANDYVAKPFGVAELMARVRASLRNRSTADLNPGGKFRLQNLEIDYDRRKVIMCGEDVALTQTEYNIVAFLSEYPGKVLTYAAIIKTVWGYPDMGSIKKLQVNMANIRKKLKIRPGENRYIINELGVGYRIQGENE